MKKKEQKIQAASIVTTVNYSLVEYDFDGIISLASRKTAVTRFYSLPAGVSVDRSKKKEKNGNEKK